MTNAEIAETSTGTAADLLATLREATGRPGLEYEVEPVALTGGFYAEMVRFRLADAPDGLAGDLVARIVPDAAMGEWEAVIQGGVADQGFPTPAVRLTAPAASPLGRYLIVMDLVDGVPPMAGLGFASIVGQIPNLMRRLPDQLAGMAAALHALGPEPVAQALDRLDTDVASSAAGFIVGLITSSAALGRDDLVQAAQHLLDTEPPGTQRVIAHGDLHPFNLLVTPDGPVLIDWTVARITHPAFTVAFTQLMLSNPPIPVPKPAAAALRGLGSIIARRFLRSYRKQATPAGQVDDRHLEWHRKIHELRILVELAGWDAAGTRPASGHPWLILEPVARRSLGV